MGRHDKLGAPRQQPALQRHLGADHAAARHGHPLVPPGPRPPRPRPPGRPRRRGLRLDARPAPGHRPPGPSGRSPLARGARHADHGRQGPRRAAAARRRPDPPAPQQPARRKPVGRRTRAAGLARPEPRGRGHAPGQQPRVPRARAGHRTRRRGAPRGHHRPAPGHREGRAQADVRRPARPALHTGRRPHLGPFAGPGRPVPRARPGPRDRPVRGLPRRPAVRRRLDRRLARPRPRVREAVAAPGPGLQPRLPPRVPGTARAPLQPVRDRLEAQRAAARGRPRGEGCRRLRTGRRRARAGAARRQPPRRAAGAGVGGRVAEDPDQVAHWSEAVQATYTALA